MSVETARRARLFTRCPHIRISTTPDPHRFGDLLRASVEQLSQHWSGYAGGVTTERYQSLSGWDVPQITVDHEEPFRTGCGPYTLNSVGVDEGDALIDQHEKPGVR